MFLRILRANYAIVAILGLSLLLSGCEDENEKKARKLMGAGLKVEETNVSYAILAYQTTVQKYPETKAALEAKRRIDELSKRAVERAERAQGKY